MSDDFDEILLQHRKLQQQMPRAWNPFFAGFGSVRFVPFN